MSVTIFVLNVKDVSHISSIQVDSLIIAVTVVDFLVSSFQRPLVVGKI